MNELSKPVRKRQNLDEKRSRMAADIQLFAKQYARPAQKHTEPNDRRYNRDIEGRLKKMRPEDVDQFLRLEDE
jgi:hypothetical protein